MSPGCDVCGCWGGCPKGNMLKGCGAALCSIVADFVTSTSTAAGIDGRLGGKPQDFVTAALPLPTVVVAAALHTLLRLHCGVRWPALHWPQRAALPSTAVGLRWVVAAPPPPRGRGHHYGRCGAAAGSHRQEGCGTARPPAPPRKTRLAAVGCRVAKRHRRPARAILRRGGCGRWVRVPEAGGGPSRSAGFRLRLERMSGGRGDWWAGLGPAHGQHGCHCRLRSPACTSPPPTTPCGLPAHWWPQLSGKEGGGLLVCCRFG